MLSVVDPDYHGEFGLLDLSEHLLAQLITALLAKNLPDSQRLVVRNTDCTVF